MILPFTINEWNALRFVAISLVGVPIIENALHRLHQLRVAHRLLNSKRARIRPSKLGNWGLHQEVEELNCCSKVSAIVVTLLYVGLSLYTECASGSEHVSRTRIWIAPASTNFGMQGKPAFYDTNQVAAGVYKGCRSKNSRIEMHHLFENIVVRKVQRDAGPFQFNSFESNGKSIAEALDESSEMRVPVVDNGSHLLFHAASKYTPGYPVTASMDDDTVCFMHGYLSRNPCISTNENISVLAVIGNLIHFQDGLLGGNRNKTCLLLSNDAFEIGGVDAEGKNFLDPLAHARTRTEAREGALPLYRRPNLPVFYLRFQYAASAAGDICHEDPQLALDLLRIPRKAKLLIHEPARSQMLPRFNRFEECIGMWQKKLQFFSESGNSSIVCYHSAHHAFCAQNHGGGVTSLSRMRPDGFDIRASVLRVWTITFRNQDAELADIARGAFVSFLMSREVYGLRRPHAEAESILRQGVPKVPRVGMPNMAYKEVLKVEERANIISWVLLLWVSIFFVGLSYLLFTQFMKPRLHPDVDFLYRHAAMQQYTKNKSVKSIRDPPTVSMRKTGEIGQLEISYDDIQDRKTSPGDLLM